MLQRGVPLTVSGGADPGAVVTVRLGDETAEVRADGQGAWTTRLGPFAAAHEPRALMAATEDGDEAEVTDLLVGDVFLAAGQSNMWWPLQHADGNNAVLRRAPVNTSLRLYREPPRCASGPRKAAGEWTGSGWEDAKQFSAIGYHFGQAYAAADDVPVGIILAARGGSPIEAWLPPGALPQEASERRAAALRAQADERAAFAAALPSWFAAYEDDPSAAPPPPAWPTDGDLAHLPGCYWGGMLHGLKDTPIAGVLWYQGETDAAHVTRGYDALLTAFLGALRANWGESLPVIVFGLPPFDPVPATALIRADQESVAAADARTTLVAADDPAADPLELHPRPKRGPAKRAAAAMRKLRAGR